MCQQTLDKIEKAELAYTSKKVDEGRILQLQALRGIVNNITPLRKDMEFVKERVNGSLTDELEEIKKEIRNKKTGWQIWKENYKAIIAAISLYIVIDNAEHANQIIAFVKAFGG